MVSSNTRQFRTFVGLFAILLGLLVMMPTIVQAESTPPPGSYYYTVKPGDTWNSVSRRTGVSVTELIRANPQAVHPNGWLWINERLLIPAKPLATGYWYQVKPGDTWNTVARATGVSVRELWRANPGLLNRQLWLYIGQRVWIPTAPPSGSAAVTATPTEAAGAVLSAQPTTTITGAPAALVAEPAVTETPQPTPSRTAPPAPVATATAPAATVQVVQPAVTAAPTTAVAAPAPTPTKLAVPAKPDLAKLCPTLLADYPDAILARLNAPGYKLEDLQAWLVTCGAIEEGAGGVAEVPVQSSKSADLVVTIKDPASQPQDVVGMLLAYHTGPTGYTLARKVEGSGLVTLLGAGDVNADGQGDLVWSDSTCGAHTCFSVLSVESWDGASYQRWIGGEPSMASAEYAFKDIGAEGTGNEIIAHGGVIGSAGAGPQRAWTEIYASVDGAPYTLLSQVYDKSSCLYHAILDANAAFDEWATKGFEPVIAAYQAAIDDRTLTKCWTLADEEAVLRDFARFRVVVADVADGLASRAETVAKQITYPALRGAAKTFLDSYKTSGSIIQACRDTTTYAKATSDSWQFLVDWGYANPTFVVDDLCPLQ